MSEEQICVLVVDDEPQYIWATKINLEARGYHVLTAEDGQTALELTASQSPDLIILDIKMPGLSGYEVCQRIREFSAVPIIMLTALAEDADKIRGLNLGADDYIVKPFNTAELLARMEAVLRRVTPAQRQMNLSTFQAGDLRIDFARQQAFVEGQAVDLTPVEYRLLYELVKHQDRVLVPEYLLDKVWETEYDGGSGLLRQAIYRLRQKIEPDPQNPRFIHTQRGVGYVFAHGAADSS